MQRRAFSGSQIQNLKIQTFLFVSPKSSFWGPILDFEFFDYREAPKGKSLTRVNDP